MDWKLTWSRAKILLAIELATAVLFASPKATGEHVREVVVAAPKGRPQLFFACCNEDMALTEAMFADQQVTASLQKINAGVAIPTDDLSPARARVVQRLNAARIPVVAWFVVPGEQGYYLNSGNALQADRHFTAFQQWTARYGLTWRAVGLDIEPDLRLFEDLRQHRMHLLSVFLAGYFDFAKVYRARKAYSVLIRRMQSQGYRVQTYQLPLIVAERKAGVTILERLLGIVDVRGDEEVVMIYTSFNKAIGPALIWTMGPDAEEIAIGTTNGGKYALTWQEFSRDLIVAAHFSRTVGVFNLEGSVQHNYLSLLETMDWGQSVSISAEALVHARRLRMVVGAVLWLAEVAPLLFLVLALGLAWVLLRIRVRYRRSHSIPRQTESR